MRLKPNELKQHQLSSEAGYLLSQIDGRVTIDDLLSLSTVGRFETLEILARLIPGAHLEVLPDVGHGIELLDPDSIVRAVDRVLAA